MSSPSTAALTPALGSITLDLRGLDATHIEAVSEILREVKGATDRISRAARKWVDLPEEVRATVIDGTPRTLRNIWERLERIGNGQLHPLLYNTFGHAANLLGKLPLDEQERYLTEKIPVAIRTPSGRPDIQRVAVEDMGTQTRLQVFKAAGNAMHVRTIAEQRAWLLEQERKREARATTAPSLTTIKRKGRWTVERGLAYIDPSKLESGLTLDDVKRLLRDMQA